MSYADIIWLSGDKDLLYRVLKLLQKHAARFNLYADHLAPSVTLFNKLGWIPLNEQCTINKCAIFYKCINGCLPGYLSEHLEINNTPHV